MKNKDIQVASTNWSQNNLGKDNIPPIEDKGKPYRLKNGTVLYFDERMSDEQIKEHINKYYPQLSKFV